MRENELEPLYSLKGGSTTREAAYADLRERSAALRGQPKLLLDIPYGPTPRERLDVFTQDGGAPVFVFIHGGYWRALDKDIFLALCAPLAARGFVAANIDYGLRPDFTVPEIVEQVLQAIAFIANNAARYGGRPDRIVLCGQSAGGHMVAWAATVDWQVLGADGIDIRAVVPVSGLFDLEPLRQTSINDDLALDADTARDLSPIHRAGYPVPPTLSVVGGDETLGFQDQTQNYTAALQAAGHTAVMLTGDGLDHFSICQALADPRSAVFTRVVAFIEAQIGL
jgi:arylformamidase